MIPLVHPIFGREEKKILNEVVDSRILASGEYVDKFEKAFAGYCGSKYGIAASNGTTALHAALLACGIKKGDMVLTTPFSFIATANSVLYCGAKPVFADIDPETYNISAAAAEAILKKDRSIRALLIVHLYGMPADMSAIMRLSKKYKVPVIEDCAQAHGAKFKGRTVGSFGAAAAFSFYATKNMTTGEGGIVLTNSAAIDALARQVVNHGRSGHSTHTLLGYNYRLTNLAAAIGLVQLGKLDGWSVARRRNAAFLNKHLGGLGFLSVPVLPEDREPVFHQYTVRVKAGLRDRFMKHLAAKGIGCGIYYPAAIYRQPLYLDLGYRKGICPEAEKAAAEVVSLPVHPSLKQEDLRKIVEAVQAFGEEL